jgi:hypothetical protein
LVSGLPLGPMTRYYLSHFFVWQLLCCCSEGALSDERTGL